MHIYSRRFVAASTCLLMGFTPVVAAAEPVSSATALQPTQAASGGQQAPTAAVQSVKVPEGTEFRMRLEDAISSESAQEGDRFTISLDEDVVLSDGTVLRSGYRGVGEVVAASKNGAFGKKGKLNLRLEYVKIGDQRIRLRGQPRRCWPRGAAVCDDSGACGEIARRPYRFRTPRLRQGRMQCAA